MAYELVELSTGNLVGYYDSERAALRDVLDAVQRDGPGAVATLALGVDEPDGSGREIARGDALAALARTTLASHTECPPGTNGSTRTGHGQQAGAKA